MVSWNIEREYCLQGYQTICGVDEAGRGPLAGCVVAAVCILPLELDLPMLDDSKKVSQKNRDILYYKIIENAIDYAIASASNEEIDQINILNATMLAMNRAVNLLKIKPDIALVDGNIVRGFEVKAIPIVGGDKKSPSIAAASILAKVTRDRMCMEMDLLYPEYKFAKHKGYPTPEHKSNIIKYGICPLHRKTFLKFLDK